MRRIRSCLLVCFAAALVSGWGGEKMNREGIHQSICAGVESISDLANTKTYLREKLPVVKELTMQTLKLWGLEEAAEAFVSRAENFLPHP